MIGTLLEVLSTPSGQVQAAVSNCLPPLMPAIQSDRPFVEGILQRLLNMLLKGDTYGVRCARLSIARHPEGLPLDSKWTLVMFLHACAALTQGVNAGEVLPMA